MIANDRSRAVVADDRCGFGAMIPNDWPCGCRAVIAHDDAAATEGRGRRRVGGTMIANDRRFVAMVANDRRVGCAVISNDRGSHAMIANDRRCAASLCARRRNKNDCQDCEPHSAVRAIECVADRAHRHGPFVDPATIAGMQRSVTRKRTSGCDVRHSIVRRLTDVRKPCVWSYSQQTSLQAPSRLSLLSACR